MVRIVVRIVVRIGVRTYIIQPLTFWDDHLRPWLALRYDSHLLHSTLILGGTPDE